MKTISIVLLLGSVASLADTAVIFPTPGPTPVATVGVPRLPCITASPRRTYLKASNNDQSDQFGGGNFGAIAVSADGSTLAVGVRDEDSNATGIGGNEADNSASRSGATYVFVRSGNTWVQQAYIKASNAEADDEFGNDVALSADGNTLVVGAPGEDSNATAVGGDQADNSSPGSGAAYVFVRSAGTWSQQAYIKGGGSAYGRDSHFGSSVTVSGDGNWVAVGAPYANGSKGAVFMLQRMMSTWYVGSVIGPTMAFTSGTSSQFGRAVALSGSGTTLAVGVPFEDSSSTGINGNEGDTSASHSGAVYIYERMQGPIFTTWPRQAYIKASAVDTGDGFGRSIDLSENGDLLAVGMPHNDGGVVGDPADNSAFNSGAAFLFARSAGVWTEDAYVKAGNIGNSDEFGRFVALRADGGLLAVSATLEDSACHCVNDGPIDEAATNSGAVYIFTRTNGVLSQRDYVKAPNTGAGDYFGHGLSLSGNGLTLAIGAIHEDSNATGVNGNMWNDLATQAGAAFVYSW